VRAEGFGDQDWLNLWHNSGLEQDWLFGGLDDGGVLNSGS
jgi:hypothetical protein